MDQHQELYQQQSNNWGCAQKTITVPGKQPLQLCRRKAFCDAAVVRDASTKAVCSVQLVHSMYHEPA